MQVLGVWDAIVVSVSLVAVFAIGLFTTFKAKRTGNASADFFLANRESSWWLLAGSLVASNIGTEHFVGQAGAAAHSGITLSLFAYCVLSLGWFFAPIYLRARLVTVPQFLEDRFNKYCRGAYALILLMVYVLSKIGTSVFAGVVLLEVILDLSMWHSVPLIIIGTTLYTVGGGLKAVLYTDTFQLLVFLVGGLTGAVTSFNLVGGMSGLLEKLDAVQLSNAKHLFQPLDDRDYPWVAMLVGIPITGVAYWCVDQEMAQRVLSGKNLSEVRLGTAAAAFLKLIPPFITVFPGVVARVLFESCQLNPDDPEFAVWCSAELDKPKKADHAYPLLIVNSFPSGIKGLMIASFIAAMMSSLSSVFNSASTVFAYDIYERIFAPEGGSSPERLKIVGRVFVCVMAALTICYLPVIDHLERGIYFLGCTALFHLAPPITALFICGIFIKRTNSQGATAGMCIGIVVGLIRYLVFLLYRHECDGDCIDRKQVLTLSNWFFCISFNYFAILLFTLTLATILLVSLFFPAPDEQIVKGINSNKIISDVTARDWFADFTFHWRDLRDQNETKSDELCLPSQEPLLVEEAMTSSAVHPKVNASRKYLASIALSIAASTATFTLLIIFC